MFNHCYFIVNDYPFFGVGHRSSLAMTLIKSRLAIFFSLMASIAVVASAGISGAVANSAETFSAPVAPIFTSSAAAPGGIKVNWQKVTANPPVTNYIVTAGPGSCPVIVGANSTSAVLPVLNGSDDLAPEVHAVNAYGISEAGSDGVSITVKNFAPASIKTMQVLQLSDFHGALEASSSIIGAAGLAAAFANDRLLVKPTVTVSAGDNIGAAPAISSQFEELPTIEAMNAMKFDVSVFGNHEHDRDVAHLTKMIGASNFQWIASNYNTLAPLKSGKKVAKTFTIIKRGGINIGFVGMNTSQTVEQVFPGNLSFTSKGKKQDLLISSKIDGVEKAAKQAKAAGADVVIALLHQGWNQNANGKANGELVDYAAQLKSADVVYGGHSHQTYASVIGGKLTAQPRNSGLEYTRTQICVDTAKNKVLGASVEHVKKAAIPATLADPATAALVKSYKDQLTSKLDVKIGTVSDRFPRGGNPPVERSSETPLGTYTAELLLAKYKTDFALINGGGIRDTLPAATYTPADKSLRRPGAGTSGPYDVTLGDAYTVFPFGNSISIVNITGVNLWAALENGVSRWPTDGRFPQVAGLKFTVDTTKPAGSRISNLTKTNGSAIAKDSTVYSVATVDFLVYGGDGYIQFDPTKQQIRDLLVDVFAEGLRADLAAGKVTLMPAATGQITIIK
jgi:5'-nucleotidase